MANRLTHRRKKCVKSANIFRDKQEYSSLYTISSRSTSSVQSLEMTSQISKQNANSRVYKGQAHKGDSATPTSSKPQNYGGKYPKLPNEISQELQQKVYSNSHKGFYSDRSQFIKSKFDKLTLENNSRFVGNKPFPKPHCPMHISANKYIPRNPQGPPPNHHYVINRLEESYWAKWKPNKCDEIDTWKSYMDQAAYNRRPRCTTTRMLPEECINMLAQTKKHQNGKCGGEKLLKIIREPREILESNSSDVGISKNTAERKPKCSCCPCPRDEHISDDDKSVKRSPLKKPDVVEAYKIPLKKTDVVESYKIPPKETDIVEVYKLDKNDHTEEEENLDTSQEEYENLYNEVYEEYQADLMDRINKYEMQKEEEMREMERHLAEQEEKRRTEKRNPKVNERLTESVSNQNRRIRENEANENQMSQSVSQQEKRIRINSEDEVVLISKEMLLSSNEDISQNKQDYEDEINNSEEEYFIYRRNLDRRQRNGNDSSHGYRERGGVNPKEPEQARMHSIEENENYFTENVYPENTIRTINSEEFQSSVEYENDPLEELYYEEKTSVVITELSSNKQDTEESQENYREELLKNSAKQASYHREQTQPEENTQINVGEKERQSIVEQPREEMEEESSVARPRRTSEQISAKRVEERYRLLEDEELVQTGTEEGLQIPYADQRCICNGKQTPIISPTQSRIPSVERTQNVSPTQSPMPIEGTRNNSVTSARNSPPNSSTISPRNSPNSSVITARNSSPNSSTISARHSPPNSSTISARNSSNNAVISAQNSSKEKTRVVFEKQEETMPEKETSKPLNEPEDYQKMKSLAEQMLEIEVTPHLPTTIEYSEPEIAILKHTDSFIINSRRQKEDRPRKPQPKFIKLTKSTFTPMVKGHTYPLKPALKKEKPLPQPIIGFSRPLSPNTPKIRNPSKQFLPAYLLRH